MAYLNTLSFASFQTMDVFLKGGISGGVAPSLSPSDGKLVAHGLHGLTLVFTTPSVTVTFADAAGAGLSLNDIIAQLGYDLNTPAATTEGTSALSTLTMASETLTLFLDGSATATEVVFGTEAGEVAILAILNTALNTLGVTATAGGGTPGGVVLTSDDGGSAKSIQVTATGGGQAKLTMAVETVTGAVVIISKFVNKAFVFVEATPTSGVVLDGASSTAATALGFGKGTVTGTVYAEPGGSAPKLITYTPSGQVDSIICTVEEA